MYEEIIRQLKNKDETKAHVRLTQDNWNLLLP